MQQLRAQRDGAAVVVRDHMRCLQAPALEQVVQQLPLDVEGDAVLGVLTTARNRACPRDKS